MTHPSSGGAVRPMLLVASQMGQKLDFFDALTLEKRHTLDHLIAQPHEMAWDPSRRLVYLTHTYRAGGYNEGKPKGHELSVIDVDRMAIVDTIDLQPYAAPHDVDFDVTRDLIYAGVESGADGLNGIVAVDAARREIVADIPLEAPNTHWIALTPDGGKCYATHKETPHITVVDLVARRQLTTIPAPGGAEEIDCSPDGRYAYAATPMMSLTINVAQGQLHKKEPPAGGAPPRLLKIDTRTDAVVGSVAFDEYISAVRVTPSGRVLVSEMHFADPDQPAQGPVRGRAHVVDAATLERLGDVPTDELPFTIRCSPDGRIGYVANLKTGTVTVIDVEARRVTATVENNVGLAFGGTHGLCYAPAPG